MMALYCKQRSVFPQLRNNPRKLLIAVESFQSVVYYYSTHHNITTCSTKVVLVLNAFDIEQYGMEYGKPKSVLRNIFPLMGQCEMRCGLCKMKHISGILRAACSNSV